MELGLFNEKAGDTGGDSVDGLLKRAAGLDHHGGAAKVMYQDDTRPALTPDHFIDPGVAVEW